MFEYHACKSFDEKRKHYDLSTDLFGIYGREIFFSLFGKRDDYVWNDTLLQIKLLIKEEKNPYYHLREDVNMVRKMLSGFRLNPDEGRIINGHTPVKARRRSYQS